MLEIKYTIQTAQKMEHKSLKHSSQCEHILAFWREIFRVFHLPILHLLK